MRHGLWGDLESPTRSFVVSDFPEAVAPTTNNSRADAGEKTNLNMDTACQVSGGYRSIVSVAEEI
jgi:hypothetical protein